MKKQITLLFVGLFISISVLSQEKAFHFGFKIAPAIDWIKPSSEKYANEGLKLGFNWGFIGDIYLMENYSIQTGFNVLYIGGSYSYPDKITQNESLFIGTTTRDLQLKYIQVPAVFRMRTNEFDRFAFYGEAGLGLAFKTGAKANDSFISDQLEQELSDQNVTKQYRFSRESLILGAGVYYNLGGSTRLFGGLRFDNNFFDIIKDQNTVDPKVANKGIANFIELNIGVLL